MVFQLCSPKQVSKICRLLTQSIDVELRCLLQHFQKPFRLRLEIIRAVTSLQAFLASLATGSNNLIVFLAFPRTTALAFLASSFFSWGTFFVLLFALGAHAFLGFDLDPPAPAPEEMESLPVLRVNLQVHHVFVFHLLAGFSLSHLALSLQQALTNLF